MVIALTDGQEGDKVTRLGEAASRQPLGPREPVARGQLNKSTERKLGHLIKG